MRYACLFAVTASAQNYQLVYDAGECFSRDKRLDSSDGEFTSANDCAAACAIDADGCGYFIYRPGSLSQCYAEYPSNPTAENSYCGEGFDSDDFDFYRLITAASSNGFYRISNSNIVPLSPSSKFSRKNICIIYLTGCYNSTTREIHYRACFLCFCAIVFDIINLNYLPMFINPF